MHGWCAEKENRGKGGSGKRKIGAGVGSCRSMDPVGISSGSRRDPVGHQFLHFWAPLLASRDPVGIQSGSSRDPVGLQSGTNVGRQPNSQKIAFLQCFCAFLGDFGCFPTGPNVVPKIRKLVPDWIPTGFLQKNTYFPKFEHLFLKF